MRNVEAIKLFYKLVFTHYFLINIRGENMPKVATPEEVQKQGNGEQIIKEIIEIEIYSQGNRTIKELYTEILQKAMLHINQINNNQ